MPTNPIHRRESERLRTANLKTALALLAVAATFFVGVIVARHLGGYVVGMSVVGFGMFAFLVFAITRHLTGRR